MEHVGPAPGVPAGAPGGPPPVRAPLPAPPPRPGPAAPPAEQAALVRALLVEQAPHLAHLPLRPLAGGRDNAVVRVGEHLAARLPRTAQAAGLLRTEQLWLPVLAPRLPVRAPVPLLAGRPGAVLPHPWSLVPWIAGSTADEAAHDPAHDPARLADGLVECLRALHVAAPPSAPRNPYRGVPLAARLGRHAEALAGHPRAAELVAALEEPARLPGPDGPPVWVHGDLHARNLLVHEGALVAVLDFGDLHAGDRATDLGGLWMLLPEQEREHVRAELGVDAATWGRSRGWALVLGALLWHIGRDEGEQALRALGEQALDAAAPA